MFSDRIINGTKRNWGMNNNFAIEILELRLLLETKKLSIKIIQFDLNDNVFYR